MSFMLPELSTMLLENKYSTGVTHSWWLSSDDQNIFIVQARQLVAETGSWFLLIKLQNPSINKRGHLVATFGGEMLRLNKGKGSIEEDILDFYAGEQLS
jgi:hypothetical protein